MLVICEVHEGDFKSQFQHSIAWCRTNKYGLYYISKFYLIIRYIIVQVAVMEEVYKKSTNKYRILSLDIGDIKTITDIISSHPKCKSILYFYKEKQTNVSMELHDILTPLPSIRREHVRNMKFTSFDDLVLFGASKKLLTNLDIIGFDEQQQPIINLKLAEDEIELYYGDSSYHLVSRIDDLLINRNSPLEHFTSKGILFIFAILFMGVMILNSLIFKDFIILNILNTISFILFFIISGVWLIAVFYLNKYEHVAINFGLKKDGIRDDIVKAIVFASRFLKFI